jgi:response regulator RpfG family c-di-GMP phosphodiesterase
MVTLVARILLAASKISLPPICAALHGHELLQTTTSQQAEKLITEDGIELFVIGIHFDDSRAMELVKQIRTDKKHEHTPIIMIRITPSEIVAFLRQTMDTMKSLKVIDDYLEVDNDPLAEVKIKNLVNKHLRVSKTKPKDQKSGKPKEP